MIGSTSLLKTTWKVSIKLHAIKTGWSIIIMIVYTEGSLDIFSKNIMFLYYVSPPSGSGDILFSRASVCLSVRPSVCLADFPSQNLVNVTPPKVLAVSFLNFVGVLVKV